MEYSKLYDLINYLQYGTKLHIGVLFLGSYGNDMVKLPLRQEIHTGILCDEFKSANFNRCYRCRNRAIHKAIKTKKDFGGICINGIYEYTRPVIINDEVASIIFIGNIFDKEKGYAKLKPYIDEKEWLFDTMEKDFSQKQCEEVGKLLESYIRILLEIHTVNPKSDPVIENIKNYIEDNLEFDIKISHIAKIFHYNEQYLGRYFKEKSGISFGNYLCLRRIKKAKFLLESSNDTIISIANKVGFNNVTYFNRVFKKICGFTPTEYRKNQIGLLEQ